MNDPLIIWTVYFNPSDFPGKFVVRGTRIGPGVFEVDKQPLIVALTLEEAREALPFGLFRMDRLPDDDAVIVECWM